MKNAAVLLSFLMACFILTSSIPAQSFRISHIPAARYSFDRFANEVYYESYIRNLNDFSLRNSPFPSVPEFAHNTHKCVYGNGDSLFVYNFADSTKFLIYDSIEHTYGYEYAFSPDDEYLLFKLHYFSFSDSSVHSMNFSPYYDFEFDFGNGTTVIYGDFENSIYIYNYVLDTLDTLFVSSLYNPYSAFTFNRETGLLYYSINDFYPKIYALNPQTHLDSLVFDTQTDSVNMCWQMPNWFKSMKWSTGHNKLAFFSFQLEAYTGLYVFDSDSVRIYKYIDCGEPGEDYFLKWLNGDTLAYVNYNDLYVYGFSLEHPLSVKESRPPVIPDGFEVTAYPNPFNGAVNINLHGKIKKPEVIIYNVNGEEIKRFADFQGAGYDYKQVWKGYNNSNEPVSSGVYFIVVRDKQDPFSIKGTAKILYLK